jgi:hypothetical protein
LSFRTEQEILLVFPLRAKKMRDFEIWSQALDAWIGHEAGKSWEDVAYFRDALMAVRQYGADYHPTQLWAYRWARQIYRVLKPGAHLLAFGGTRTYHRIACAIEDAGFEIRDSVLWLYGTGFPKSHNLEGDGEGWGTALKPSCEPIVLARKPLDGTVAGNFAKWGTGALNIDGCRIGYDERINPPGSTNARPAMGGGWREDAAPTTANGRWPANIIHDGSDDVVGAFPESNSGTASGYDWSESVNDNPSHVTRNIKSGVHFGDNGSAAQAGRCWPAFRRQRRVAGGGKYHGHKSKFYVGPPDERLGQSGSRGD